MKVLFEPWDPPLFARIKSENGEPIVVSVSSLEPHELDDLCNRWRAAVWAAAKQPDPYTPPRPKKGAKQL